MFSHDVELAPEAFDADAAEPVAADTASPVAFSAGGAIPPIAGVSAHAAPTASELAFEHAEASLQAMHRTFEPHGHTRDRLGKKDPATAWSLSQAIGAELDVAKHTHHDRGANAAIGQLAAYKEGDAYAPTIHPGRGEHRFRDDNGWLGLDFMQEYQQTHRRADLHHAEALFPFLQAGQAKGGGERWEEHAKHPVRNMAASGSTAELALELYAATGRTKYLRFAKQNERFMNARLRRPDGTYNDTLEQNGHVDKGMFTYNQGVAIGTEVGLFRATHDARYLARARQTAAAAVHAFGQGDRLWRQPPSFNAIFFRDLRELDAVAPDPSYKALLDQYLARAWQHARDPRSGLFDRGGIGTYDSHHHVGLLDESAFAQMYVLQADWHS